MRLKSVRHDRIFILRNNIYTQTSILTVVVSVILRLSDVTSDVLGAANA